MPIFDFSLASCGDLDKFTVPGSRKRDAAASKTLTRRRLSVK